MRLESDQRKQIKGQNSTFGQQRNLVWLFYCRMTLEERKPFNFHRCLLAKGSRTQRKKAISPTETADWTITGLATQINIRMIRNKIYWQKFSQTHSRSVTAVFKLENELIAIEHNSFSWKDYIDVVGSAERSLNRWLYLLTELQYE